jgi:hypothetical protein
MSEVSSESSAVVTQEVKPPSPGEIVENRRANYNRLVRTARLANLVLDGLNFKIHAEALGVKKALLTRSIAPKTKVMSPGTTDGTCVANIVWEVTFRFKRRAVMKCTASYIISYEGVTDCSEETATIFVENVGKVATYAYFRALFAQLDWSATLGFEPLPILQLQPKL